MTRAVVRVVTAVLTSILGFAFVSPVDAAAPPKISALVLLSQTPWVSGGGSFSVRIAAPPDNLGDPADLEYAVSVHPSSPTRTAFLRTLSQRPNTSPLSVITTPMTDAATDEAGAVTLDIGVQDPTQPRDRARVALRGAGVYPVAVELRSVGGAVHDRLLTHLLFQPTPPNGPRLAVATVVPIRAPIALQPNGGDRLRVADVAAIADVATALDTLPPNGVLLDPSPETLGALARSKRAGDRAALAALQPVAASRTVVAEPFVATQTPEASAADHAAVTARGRDLTALALGVEPSSAVAVLTEPSDARLSEELPARVIIRDKLLQTATQRVTTAAPVGLRRENSRVVATGLVGDGDLAAHFSNESSPVLAAHQLLADLATIYFDSPGRTRSIVVLPPSTWRADAALLTPLLAGIESSPILEAASLERLFTPTPSASASNARVVQPPPTPPRAPAAFASVRRSIGSLQSVFADSPVVAQSFSDRLLIAEAAAFSARERRTYVNALADAITAERHKFELPRGGSLTLTARRGGIPITVRSTSGYPVRVVLQIASDRLKFPEGSTKALQLSRRETTARFTVQTQGSGAFPLRILLKSPDGQMVLTQSRLTIRSTNVSGVGIALSAGALLFLLVWWRRHHTKRKTAPAS